MTLTEYYALLPSDLSASEKISLTQKAYDDIVQKRRLHPSIHPVVISQAANIGGFENKIIVPTILSELCFKEVKHILNANIVTVLTSDRTSNTAYTNDITAMDTDYLGYTQEEFEAFNDEWGITPSVYNMGTKYIVTNTDDDVMLYIAGYVYPYFALTTNGPYVDYHTYTLSNIVDTSLYDVNPYLFAYVYFKSISLYYNDNENINLDAIFHKFMLDLMNYYNSNERLKYGDNWEVIGLLSTDWLQP